eukprot:204272-Chlamydomonas_euryale.AAC.2
MAGGGGPPCARIGGYQVCEKLRTCTLSPPPKHTDPPPSCLATGAAPRCVKSCARATSSTARPSSWSAPRATRSTWWRASRPAPTTTSSNRLGATRSWRASGRTCALGTTCTWRDTRTSRCARGLQARPCTPQS